MAIRNFWISADIDGRKTDLSGGPIRKDGGFDLKVYIREDGAISRKALYVMGRAEDGKLTLRAYTTGDDNTPEQDAADLVIETRR